MPDTPAGRALLDWFGGPMRDENSLVQQIVEVERQAAAQARAEVRARLDDIRDSLYEALGRWDEAARHLRDLNSIERRLHRRTRLDDGTHIPAPRRSALSGFLAEAVLAAIDGPTQEPVVGYCGSCGKAGHYAGDRKHSCTGPDERPAKEAPRA